MLLDTTVLVDVLRSRPATAERLHRHGGPFFVSAMSVDEIVYGLRPGEEERTHQLIDGLEVLPVGLDEARLAAGWRRSLRGHGVTLTQADCLIAATAVLSGMPLATANIRHFPMPDVQVEEWPSA